MPGWGVEVIADTFTPKLKAAGGRIRGEVAQQMKVVGADMEALARELVPVDTGFLQSTIFHKVDPGNLSLELGAMADYAFWVEIGTTRMAAQPFIRPAFDAGQQKLLDALLHGVLYAFQ